MNLAGLISAVQFLTRLPAPSFDGESGRDLARAAPWFPVAGALVGAAVAIAVWAGAGAGPWIGALLGILAWALITGALHLDGLGDVADGLGAAHGDPERFIEVARDPHIGAFGVVAIALQLAAKLVLLAALAPGGAFAALILTAAWARWGCLVQGYAAAPLGQGLARRFAAGIDLAIVALEALALAALSLFVAPVLVAAVPIAFGLAFYWRRRLGGVTGDCHGASIEITETLLLLLLVVAG